MLTAPFAIALDAITFFVSALMLRRMVARNDVPNPVAGAGIWNEIGEGLKLVWENRTLWGLAWLAGTWQILHHMQIAVLILFATRELGLSAGAIGVAYACGGLGCVLASMSVAALVSALRYRSGDRPRPDSDRAWVAGLRADRRAAVATTSNRAARRPARCLRRHP